MRNKYNCISGSGVAGRLLMILLVILPNIFFAQQSPSIQTGVTFQWADTQSNNSDSATIQSITIDGTVYNTFVVPSSYEMTRLGPDGHNPNNIRLNGGVVVGNSSAANWATSATQAFQSKNLNHYFEANPNGRNICSNFGAAPTTDAQKQTIFYNPAIPSNQGGVLAVTERGGNNCFYIEVWGTPPGGGPEQKLGETFVRNQGNYTGCNFGPPLPNSDYWQSGRCNENGQTVGIGLFYLDDLAPTGSQITKIEFIAATRDHGDGKFFILQKYAVDQQGNKCLNEVFNGNLHEVNNVPLGSTYSIVTPPSPAGQSFSFNSDGTYTYVPSPGFIGDVTFEYEVCLPAPNTSVCDTAEVTLSYIAPPDDPEFTISCNGTVNEFTVSVTHPLGDIYDYSVDGGTTYQDSPIFDGLSPGSYTLLVRNKFIGCVTSYTSNPVVLTTLNLTENITDVLCRSEATGSIDVTVSGGNPPYTYSWNNGSTTEDLINVIAGNYTVTITDANDCIISQDFTINQPAQGLTSTRSINDVVCNGDSTGSVDLTVNGGTPPYTFLWSNGSTSEDISDLFAGTYNVTITDANGCTTTNSATVTEPDAVPCQIIVDNCPPTVDTACSNDDLGTPVSWDPPNFAYQCCTSSPGDDYSFNVEFDLPESGNDCWDYNRVQRIGSNNLRLFQSSGTNVNFTTPLSYFDTSLGVDINMELIVPSGTFDWNLEVLANSTVIYSNTVTSISASGLQTITIPNSVPSGDYRLRFNFDDNGTNLNASDQIEVDRLYYNAILLETACLDGINFGVTSNYNPGDAFPDGDTTVIYTATYTYPDGSTDQLTCEFNVEVFDIELTESTVDKEDVSCNGESDGSFAINATGGSAPYLYSLDNIDFSNTTGVFSDLSAGSYTVYVKDDNGCEETIDIVISEPAILEVNLDESNNVDCAGIANGNFTVSAVGGTLPYLFSIDGGTTNQSSGLFENLSSGSYTVLVTDANGCTTSIMANVGINDNENPQISVPSNLDIEGCSSADITSGNTVFNFNDSGSADVQSVFSNNPNYNASDDFNIASITYTDIITSADNCPLIVERTFTVTDNCNNSETAVQIITVEDKEAPTFNEALPTDVTVECDAVPTAETLTASDNCGTATVTFEETTTAGTCDNDYTLTRTWTATDACGNETVHTQTITVQDTVAPTF
ncbi:HYR-like domain-containing protein, partial [Winogradskyella aquimaris]